MSYAIALLRLTGIRGWKVMDDSGCDAAEFMKRIEGWPRDVPKPSPESLEIEYNVVVNERRIKKEILDLEKHTSMNRRSRELHILVAEKAGVVDDQIHFLKSVEQQIKTLREELQNG